MSIFTPRNFHATLIYVLSLILVVLPFSTLPAAAQTPPSERDPNENKLPKSSGVAVLRTTAPPLPNAPSLDEIKRKGDDLELKKPSKPKEKLPNANRCRPGDFVCQDYWKKQGKPSTNIGQFIPREPSSPMN